MICNAETKRGLEKISGFMCDGIKYRKISVVGTSVVKANCVSADRKSVMVRWERGRGWREAGSGYGGDNSKVYYPIIGGFDYDDE